MVLRNSDWLKIIIGCSEWQIPNPLGQRDLHRGRSAKYRLDEKRIDR